jgi:L-rhamnose-H+ transport protein
MGVLSGIFLVVLGGALNGSFAAPMKFSKDWAWENIWLLYSVIGLLCIPLISAVFSIPNLAAVYGAAGSDAMASAMLFGFGWGIGSVLFGLGIHVLGMALGFPIILGLTAALGSLIPLVVLSPNTLHTMRGASVLIGLSVVALGVILCARAGGMKSASRAGDLTGSRYRVGLLLCIGSGVFNAMLNLALAFGTPIADAAIKNGVAPNAAQNAIWALAVSAGSLANIGYSLFLLCRNKTWDGFRARGSGRNLFLASVMGALWMGGITIYGAAAVSLGHLGVVVGWPLFMSMVIISGNVWGFITGEWHQAPIAAWRLNFVGVGVLIAAIAIISIGGAL